MSKRFLFFGRSSSLLMLIFYKLLLAVIEMLAGALCLIGAFFVEHASLASVIATTATTSSLDRSVNWIIQELVSSTLEYEIIVHVGLILIAFGVFNILLAIGVWFKSHKMRIIALLVFGALSLYSTIKLFNSFSALDLVSLILDLILLYYFWRILPKHLEN